MKKVWEEISEGLGIVLIACCIGFVAFIVVGAYALLLPFRLAIDAAANRRKKMCFKCAYESMDMEQAMQIIYHREPGAYRCAKCRCEYVVDRRT